MNTMTNPITESIVATFNVSTEPFDKDFSSLQHLRDYCDSEFGCVHLESFTLHGVCFESLAEYDGLRLVVRSSAKQLAMIIQTQK